MLFLYLLRRLCSLYASFHWWDESHWLICLCWTILWPGDKSHLVIVHYPLNVLWKFDLLIFHWRYLILCLLEILVYCFIFLWCLYFTLESRWFWPHQMNSDIWPFLLSRRIGINSLCMFDRMYQWSHLALVFSLWGSLWLLLQLLILLGLFMLLYFLKLF